MSNYARYEHMRSRTRTLAVLVLLNIAAWSWAADEITLTQYLRVKNGVFDQTKNVAQLKVDQLGKSMTAQIQVITSNNWQLVYVGPDVATNGYAFFRNNTTNVDRWIEVANRAIFTNSDATAITNYCSFMRLRASEPQMMRLHPTNALYARAYGTNDIAISAGLNLEYWINED